MSPTRMRWRPLSLCSTKSAPRRANLVAPSLRSRCFSNRAAQWSRVGRSTITFRRTNSMSVARNLAGWPDPSMRRALERQRFGQILPAGAVLLLVFLGSETRAAGGRRSPSVSTRIERVEPQLAGRHGGCGSGCGAKTRGSTAGDDRQRRVRVERRLIVAARQIERAAADDVREQIRLRRRRAARSSRTDRA